MRKISREDRGRRSRAAAIAAALLGLFALAANLRGLAAPVPRAGEDRPAALVDCVSRDGKPWAIIGEGPDDKNERCGPRGMYLAGRPFDLNRADASDLGRLPGIGPKRAEAIVGRRRELGGFTDMGQAEDIPGLTRDARAALRQWTYIE